MGIETTRILDEIDKHTARARDGEPEKIRESLAAIRALCDLLLEDGMQAPKKPAAIGSRSYEASGRRGERRFAF